MRIVPRVGLVRPRIILIVEVLPAPFGPRSPKISPPRSESEIPSTAVNGFRVIGSR